jgi:hypothetical protein
MLILTRSEFMEQPSGIFYRKAYGNHGFGQIEIKAANCGERDFVCMDFGYVCSESELDMMTGGKNVPINTDYYGRDGCFEDDATFLVYQDWDLKQMQEQINRAISVAPKQIFESDKYFSKG